MFDKKTRKKFTILCLNVWGSTLNCKFLTGFFVVSQIFTTDCSSLEIFSEILKTSRHKELAFLWRDVLRIFSAFLSGWELWWKSRPPLNFFFAQRYYQYYFKNILVHFLTCTVPGTRYTVYIIYSQSFNWFQNF